MVDAQSVINWTIAGQLSWQYLRALTVYHTDREALCKAWFRHAGQLATVDICLNSVSSVIPNELQYCTVWILDELQYIDYFLKFSDSSSFSFFFSYFFQILQLLQLLLCFVLHSLCLLGFKWILSFKPGILCCLNMVLSHSKYGQRHIVSWRRKLSTDLFTEQLFVLLIQVIFTPAVFWWQRNVHFSAVLHAAACQLLRCRCTYTKWSSSSLWICCLAPETITPEFSEWLKQ